MIDQAAWQRTNDEYLGIALSWLRARLDAITPVAQPCLPSRDAPVATASDVAAAAPEERAESSFWDRFTSRDRRPSGATITTASITASARIALPRTGAYDAVAVAGDLERQLREREIADPPPALLMLANRLGLTEFERNVMLLVCATELDTRVAAHCARAQDEMTRPYPTFALAMALFDAPSWDVLSPERPLRYWRLVEITQPSGTSLMASVLRADERIVNYVKGLNYLDDRLAAIATPLDAPALHMELPSSHADSVRRVVDALPHDYVDTRLPMVQLTGVDGPTKQLVAAHAAAAVNRELYHVAAESLPTSSGELELLARLWDREAALMPLALYLDEPLVEGPAADASSASLDRFASRVRSLTFVSSREPRPLRGTLPVLVDVSRATATEQRDVWRALLPDADALVPDRLSAQFDLSLPVIDRVVADARAASAGAAPTLDVLWRASLAATRPRLEQLARRIDPRATWDDLVLPVEQLGTLRQLVAQVSQRSRVYEDWGWGERMNRGLGITALFAGESGTGKTMAAEVIARELQLDLYRIDLSGVVSKYIGETEKNLRRVFDAAEAGGAILLFDEADALFGKRSEVKDSHDRYANVEINYLLQRLEAYRGLAILTTNMKSAMDQAFTRRLRFVVDFPFPGVEERRRMWTLVFPPETERAGLDVERLARFALTGGSIHNVALNSAFLSAHAGEPVTMPRVLEALRGEYRKLARPVSESDFRALVADGGGAARA